MNENWYNQIIDDVEKNLETNVTTGLTDEQVGSKREKYGYNELKEGKKKSLFVKFLEQFKDFMVIVLIIAAIISAIVGVQNGEGFTDTIIILIVIICNAIIGVAQESKAEKSLEALKKLSSHTAKVLRNGKMVVLQSRELVPGDVVVIETGDFIPADCRIIEAVNLKVQEASLTGESVPVEKDNGTIANKEVGIGDRTNMLYSSSLVTYGRGRAIVVETGMKTEVGRIAESLSQATQNDTPLQIKLDKLGKTLGIVCLVICAFIFVFSVITQKINGVEVNYLKILMTAVSLAVAAIPEGLAAVSTIVLAIGMQRMVKKNAIIKKLPAVETLGSATVICSDKTGTLTQNKMTVQKVFANNELLDANKELAHSNELDLLINVCVLCNDTIIAENNTLKGDPTETCLTALAMKQGYSIEELENHERVEEVPFDSERKLMTTVNKNGNQYFVYTKGGIDELLERCNSYIINGEIKNDILNYKNTLDEQNDNLAHDALRVLAMAYKEIDHMPSKEEMKDIENDLTFIGMVGMIDPPRVEVKAAVDKCKTAGIKTVMITGDHKATAVAIAKNLGILEKDNEAVLGADVDKMSQEELENKVRDISVYARVSPENKVRIVKAWQTQGEIAAMTGDGVNDAPALKQADIGCAMGITGTDVSKEAADVILTDDNFATIVSAVEEGRRIYDNILKAIQFLLSSNVGEVILLFLATVLASVFSKAFGIELGLIEVLTPVHLLWINLVTDSLPALALAVDPPEKDIMNRKPLKTKGIFTKGMTWRILYQGAMIGLLALAAFTLGLNTPGSIIDNMAKDNGWQAVGEKYYLLEYSSGSGYFSSDFERIISGVYDRFSSIFGMNREVLSEEEYERYHNNYFGTYTYTDKNGNTYEMPMSPPDYVAPDVFEFSDKYIVDNKEMSISTIRVEIGQTMAFIVLAFSELVHIFNIRNSKKSLLKTGIGGNKLLFLAIAIDACLMFAVVLIPALRNIFGILALPSSKIWECVVLIFAPVVIVEIMKLFKLNGTKSE